MNLYLISQDEVDGYDTYSDAVVAANTVEEAATLHPNGQRIPAATECGTWTNDPNNVTVNLIGTAMVGTEVGVICASFHAG